MLKHYLHQALRVRSRLAVWRSTKRVFVILIGSWRVGFQLKQSRPVLQQQVELSVGTG